MCLHPCLVFAWLQESKERVKNAPGNGGKGDFYLGKERGWCQALSPSLIPILLLGWCWIYTKRDGEPRNTRQKHLNSNHEAPNEQPHGLHLGPHEPQAGLLELGIWGTPGASHCPLGSWMAGSKSGLRPSWEQQKHQETDLSAPLWAFCSLLVLPCLVQGLPQVGFPPILWVWSLPSPSPHSPQPSCVSMVHQEVGMPLALPNAQPQPSDGASRARAKEALHHLRGVGMGASPFFCTQPPPQRCGVKAHVHLRAASERLGSTSHSPSCPASGLWLYTLIPLPQGWV